MKPTFLFAALVLAAPLAAPAIAQSWTSFSNPQAGFAVQFPAPPTITTGIFRAAGTSAPDKVYAVTEGSARFSLTVADFTGLSIDEKALTADVEHSLTQGQTVADATDARVGRSYGRELSLHGPDGARSTVAIFFAGSRLYELVGQSLPPDAALHSGDMVRFEESLQLTAAGGQDGPGGGEQGPGGRFGRGRGGGFAQGGQAAVAACQGKSAGDQVQLQTSQGSAAATCVLVARPNTAPGQGGAAGITP